MPDAQQLQEEGYVDLISLKSIEDIIDPVLSPYTGHIYERAAIVDWINKHGNDPLDTSKPLTVAMLVPGFAIKQITKTNDKLSAKIDKMSALLEKVVDQNAILQQKVENLEKIAVNPVWLEHGFDIDKKLRQGSSPEREKALRTYATKVRTASTEGQLKEAVNDTAHLKSKKISTPRYFGWFAEKSDTTKVVTKFQDKVNSEKGWEPKGFDLF